MRHRRVERRGPMPTGRVLTLQLVPAALVLVVVAAADRLGLATAVFYLFLVGIPISGASALAAYGRLVDAVDAGRPTAGPRLQAALAALLVAMFVVGAGSRSPTWLELEAPGLARAALVLGFLLLAAQAVAALVPARR
jgi:hypothetical protein